MFAYNSNMPKSMQLNACAWRTHTYLKSKTQRQRIPALKYCRTLIFQCLLHYNHFSATIKF